MKILIACYFYLPSVAGIWGYVKELKQALERAGHDVDILTHHPDVLKYYIANKGNYLTKYKVKYQVQEKLIPLYNQYFPGLDPHVKEFELERYSFEVAASCFDIWKYDLIHTQDVISTRAISRIKPPQTPIIATIHGTYPHEMLLQGKILRKNSFHWHYAVAQDYYGATSADKVIVPSQWLKKILHSEYQVPADLMSVVPYGIDMNLFSKRAEAKSLVTPPKDKKIIVCSARLSAEKGHVHLLEALAKLKKERSDWVCWMLGDGDLWDDLKEKTNDLKLGENVIFFGRQNNVLPFLKQADICVLPSIHDNLPFAVMEAQLTGKPIVVTDAGGLPEMVAHGKTGLMARLANGESLYRNIKTLLENEPLRDSLGKNGKTWAVNQWSIDKMMNSIFDHYEDVFQRKHKGTILPAKENRRAHHEIKFVSDQLLEMPTAFDGYDYDQLWKRILPKLPKDYSLIDPDFIKVLQTHLKFF